MIGHERTCCAMTNALLSSGSDVYRNVLLTLRREGIVGVLRAVVRRVRGGKAPTFKLIHAAVADKIGIEIGGPSAVFMKGGLLPIYPLPRRLDNCNFDYATIWEGRIAAGRTFRFDPSRDPGCQLICEGSALVGIESASYDFVLSSHALEHMANPIGALREWQRVLKCEGTLALIVPHRDGTFDHRRPITPLVHLVEDFEKATKEDDTTHFDEIFSLHDLEMDPPAGDLANFIQRSRDNAVNRSLHHHVFSTRSCVEMVEFAGFQVIDARAEPPFHIIVVARKLAVEKAGKIRPFLPRGAARLRRSPFATDREEFHKSRARMI